jgi:hypothetical protein
MKVRTIEELSDFLAEELARRRREISALHVTLKAARVHESEVLRRAGFLMLYCHWEGFVKAAGAAYINYVNYLRLPCNRLSTNFTAMALKSRLEALGETRKASVVTTFLSEFSQRCADVQEFVWHGEIDTRSNLSSDVLREIACLLGLDYSSYATKEQFLDREFLAVRNQIAHGDHAAIDGRTYEQAQRIVLGLLEAFRTDIENAAAQKSYLRT